MQVDISPSSEMNVIRGIGYLRFVQQRNIARPYTYGTLCIEDLDNLRSFNIETEQDATKSCALSNDSHNRQPGELRMRGMLRREITGN